MYLYDRLIMGDAIATLEAAKNDLNANIYEGRDGYDSADLQRSLEKFITAVPAAAEAAALRPPPARLRVQPRPPASDEDLLWANPTPRRRAASDADSLEDVNPDADDTDSIDLDAEPLRREVDGDAEALDEVSSEASDDAAADPDALAVAH